jgi:5'-3' exonuclease
MTLAIIDGDVLCYRACKTRWQSKARIENDTAFVSLDDEGRREQPAFTKEEDRRYLEASWENFQRELQELLETTFCTDYVMAVKSGDSFRDRMYPIQLNEGQTKAIWGYKANRWKPEGARNKFVTSLRELAVMSDMATPAVNREADDLIRIWANEARAAGQPYVVCSIDKDLMCIPGMHYLMHHEKLVEVSAEAALRHYYEQLLKGDATDNIPGVPGVGAVKAAKILAPFNTEAEYQYAVVNAYMTAYGDDWEHLLLSNGKMVHLQQNAKDYFSLSQWDIVKELRQD